MKNINIDIPKGYEVDLEKSSLEEGKIVFKEAKKKLPVSWEDLTLIGGWFSESDSRIKHIRTIIVEVMHKNIFPTKAEVEASIALAQLCQLRDAYNGEPLAEWCDWMDENTKYTIIISEGKLVDSYYTKTSRVLTFKTRELRDTFLSKPEIVKLIEIAKPLL